MRNFIIRLVVNALALAAAAFVVDGIQLSGTLLDILVVAFVFGLINAILKPILMLLSLPFIVVTLGFFALVVNGVLLLLTARLTDAFSVAGLGSAILGSLVISLVTIILGGTMKDDKGKRKG